MAAMVVAQLCIGCGVCRDFCPTQAIEIKVKIAHINADLCNECEECVFACPQGAITL